MTIANKTGQMETKIAVIQGKIDSLPLLGRQTHEDPGMVKFNTNGGLKQPNRTSIKKVYNVKTKHQVT